MPLERQDHETRLIEAAQKDPRRFAEIYELQFEGLYAYVASRVRNRAEAEDITSNVFHLALENLPRYELRGVPFRAWLFRIAANEISDRWQRVSRERGNPQVEAQAANEISPEQAEEYAQLFRMVRILPQDQRMVIEMRFAEEKSIREIAKALGKSEGAIKQLQFRAIENLRKKFIGETDRKNG